MQLHQFFSTAESIPPPTKEVKFRVVSKVKAGALFEVTALLALVNDVEQREAIRDAEVALRKEYDPEETGGIPVPVPPKARQDEEVYQLLFRVLRDVDDPGKPLARTVLELRTSIQPATAADLIRAYNTWVEAEFPDTVSPEVLKKLETDAQGK